MLGARLRSALGSIALALSALMLIGAKAAHADVIEQTLDFAIFCAAPENMNGPPCEVEPQPDSTATLQFNQFNPSLGTLTAVTFTLTSGFTAHVDIDSTDPTDQLTVTETVTLTVDAPDVAVPHRDSVPNLEAFLDAE
jgi:hypothetical protein